jgi:hypothetical protein
MIGLEHCLGQREYQSFEKAKRGSFVVDLAVSWGGFSFIGLGYCLFEFSLSWIMRERGTSIHQWSGFALLCQDNGGSRMRSLRSLQKIYRFDGSAGLRGFR